MDEHGNRRKNEIMLNNVDVKLPNEIYELFLFMVHCNRSPKQTFVGSWNSQ